MKRPKKCLKCLSYVKENDTCYQIYGVAEVKTNEDFEKAEKCDRWRPNE